MTGWNIKPFVVAEMSGNHNGSLERALGIVQAAKEAGCDAVKIQTYKPESMALDGVGIIGTTWEGVDLNVLYEKAALPFEWHEPIFKRCMELGIECFSTIFDAQDIEFLEGLGTSYYKIASFEITHLPLIKAVAKTRKIMIISTGMATEAEIKEAVATARGNGCPAVILMKCTSAYPADPREMNLATIPDMKSKFGCDVGLSDHTLGVGVGIASVAYGAFLIEKHLTLSRSEGGVDAAFSMDPAEMKLLVQSVKDAWLAKGRVTYGPTESERSHLQFRRSIYVVKDLKKGDVLTENNIKILRPESGLKPFMYELVLGSTISKDIKNGTPFQQDMLEKVYAV